MYREIRMRQSRNDEKTRKEITNDSAMKQVLQNKNSFIWVLLTLHIRFHFDEERIIIDLLKKSVLTLNGP